MTVWLLWKDHKVRITKDWPSDGPWLVAICKDKKLAEALAERENKIYEKETLGFKAYVIRENVLESVEVKE